VRLVHTKRTTNHENNEMKPFKITDLTLLEPLHVMAESQREAAGYLVACLDRMMGQMPMIECEVEAATIATDSNDDCALAAGRRGFAWCGEGGWSVFDPLGEHV